MCARGHTLVYKYTVSVQLYHQEVWLVWVVKLIFLAHSFPRASLSENCSLLETDNVRGQISVHIFAPNGGYCLIILHIISWVTKYSLILMRNFSVNL